MEKSVLVYVRSGKLRTHSHDTAVTFDVKVRIQLYFFSVAQCGAIEDDKVY